MALRRVTQKRVADIFFFLLLLLLLFIVFEKTGIRYVSESLRISSAAKSRIS